MVAFVGSAPGLQNTLKTRQVGYDASKRLKAGPSVWRIKSDTIANSQKPETRRQWENRSRKNSSKRFQCATWFTSPIRENPHDFFVPERSPHHQNFRSKERRSCIKRRAPAMPKTPLEKGAHMINLLKKGAHMMETSIGRSPHELFDGMHQFSQRIASRKLPN
jgi:hypothetical protein